MPRHACRHRLPAACSSPRSLRRWVLTGCVVVVLGRTLSFPSDAAATTHADATGGLGAVRANIPVCVIDSGVEPGTPGVTERLSVTGSIEPSGPHGRQMVEIVRRAFPSVSIISVQRLDSTGRGTVEEAIDLCIVHGARVVSMSFVFADGQFDRTALEAAVGRARAAGALVTAAAGNSGKVQAPADVPGVVAVGASGDDGACSFSAADHVLLAPGCDVVGSATEGTSDANAYVAGVAAGLMAYSGLDAAAVTTALRASGRTVDLDRARAIVGLPARAQPLAARPAPFASRSLRCTQAGRRVALVVANRRRGDRLLVSSGRRSWSRRTARVTVTTPRGQRLLYIAVVATNGEIAARAVVHLRPRRGNRGSVCHSQF